MTEVQFWIAYWFILLPGIILIGGVWALVREITDGNRQ